ncbi:hypothetical protein L1887_58791 [Cichorium endivia]|nr:hypothetical protein L1887_58791 [Cichorium endivia]
MIARLTSYTTGWRWIPTSESELGQSETKIFSYLRRKFQCYAVDVSTEEQKENENKRRWCRPEERKIWTIEMEDPKTNKPPIVLLHGFAASIGFWALNLDSLSMHRKVYAIDLIGFGRSTRPDLSKKEHPEDDIVDSIELWRQRIGIEKPFILLGPFIWGFAPLQSLAIVRVAGPYGPRTDEIHTFDGRGLEGDTKIMHIIQTLIGPSGETVFKKLLSSDLSARRPIVLRANELDIKIKLNFLYATQPLRLPTRLGDRSTNPPVLITLEPIRLILLISERKGASKQFDS